jgi:hypothetical protein
MITPASSRRPPPEGYHAYRLDRIYDAYHKACNMTTVIYGSAEFVEPLHATSFHWDSSPNRGPHPASVHPTLIASLAVSMTSSLSRGTRTAWRRSPIVCKARPALRKGKDERLDRRVDARHHLGREREHGCDIDDRATTGDVAEFLPGAYRRALPRMKRSHPTRRRASCPRCASSPRPAMTSSLPAI